MFFHDLTTNFSATTQKSEAIFELGRIKQGNKTVEEHNIAFKSLIAKAGLDAKSNNDLLVEQYRRSLNQQVATKVMMMENVPVSIGDWFTKAAVMDNNWRRIQATFGRSSPNQNRNANKPRWAFKSASTYRDPNAMDVDAIKLTPEEKAQLQKDRACFNCQKPGHIAANCFRRKGNSPSTQQPQERMKGKALATHIRSLLQGLTPEEEEEVYKFGQEDQDFPSGDL